MKARLWLLLSLLVGATMWLYMHRILQPWEYYVNVERGRLKAQMGDLYPRWVGTRNLLLYKQNPYGPETSREIQIGFYGHPIVQDYAHLGPDPIDEQRFVYPIYIVFLLAPTVHADFALLNAATPFVFAILIGVSVLVWMSVLRWRPPPELALAVCVLFIASPQIAQGLRLRQLAMLVAFTLALGAWCVARNHLALAGGFLALSTIKPQMVILPLAWFLIWSLGDFARRWKLIAAFAATMALLIGAGQILLPGWPRDFLLGIAAYRKYFPITSLLRFALGEIAGGLVSAAIVVALLIFAWKRRAVDGDSPEFVQILAAFFIVSALVLPLMVPANQVLLLLPLLILLRDWTHLPRLSRLSFVFLAGWPWLTAFVMLLIPPQVRSMSRFPLLPSVLVLFIPFAVPLWLMASARRKLRSQIVHSPAATATSL